MATALAEQLQQLSTRFGDASTSQRLGKASLLFSPREAADIDLETVYHIGLTGGFRLDTLISAEKMRPSAVSQASQQFAVV